MSTNKLDEKKDSPPFARIIQFLLFSINIFKNEAKKSAKNVIQKREGGKGGGNWKSRVGNIDERKDASRWF